MSGWKPEYNNKRNLLRKERIKKGLCIFCGDPAKEYKTCELCRISQREERRDRDRIRRESGKCISCANFLEENDIYYCVSCKQKRSTFNSKLLVNEYLVGKKCLDCGIGNVVVLQFHHRNPEDKKFTIATVRGKYRRPHEIAEEMEKCDIVCANCHLIRHHTLRNGKK